jgi:hypothetical protein
LGRPADDPLLTYTWTSLDNAASQADSTAVVNSLRSDPLTAYVANKDDPFCPEHGMFKVWVYYANHNADTHVLCAIDVEWDYYPADRKFVQTAMPGDMRSVGLPPDDSSWFEDWNDRGRPENTSESFVAR